MRVRMRKREWSQGSWFSGQADPQKRAHSWPSEMEEGAHLWPVSKAHTTWHRSTRGLWTDFLSLPHACPQGHTPVYLQEVHFLWYELGLSSWLRQWPLLRTSLHFGVSELPFQGLFYFLPGLASSLSRWQTCAHPLFRCSTLENAFEKRYSKMVHPNLWWRIAEGAALRVGFTYPSYFTPLWKSSHSGSLRWNVFSSHVGCFNPLPGRR